MATAWPLEKSMNVAVLRRNDIRNILTVIALFLAPAESASRGLSPQPIDHGIEPSHNNAPVDDGGVARTGDRVP